MSNEGLELAQSRRLNGAVGLRRMHLAALDAAVVADPHGLACGVVRHGQAPPVLNVIAMGHPGRAVEVGSGLVNGRWWFLVEPGGEAVTPVDEVDRAPEVLAGILARVDIRAGIPDSLKGPRGRV